MDPYTEALIVLPFLTTAYSIILHAFHNSYHPRWTWLTVVIGNSILGGAWAWVWFRGALPLAIALFYFETQVAGGMPVVVWQLWENHKRDKERKGRRYDEQDTTAIRGESAHQQTQEHTGRNPTRTGGRTRQNQVES
jgi:hypothetical protein